MGDAVGGRRGHLSRWGRSMSISMCEERGVRAAGMGV